MEKKKVLISVVLILFASFLLATMSPAGADDTELWCLRLSAYIDEEPSFNDWIVAVYENTTFTIKVYSQPWNFQGSDLITLNAAVTFENETKYTDKNGIVTFVAPEIQNASAVFDVLVNPENDKGIIYVARPDHYYTYGDTAWVIVYNSPAKGLELVKEFSSYDPEGCTPKFNITEGVWEVKWNYSTLSDSPFFSYRLLDKHENPIYALSSFDSTYDVHGVVYLEGSGEDFYFEVETGNLSNWSINVYQKDYKDKDIDTWMSDYDNCFVALGYLHEYLEGVYYGNRCSTSDGFSSFNISEGKCYDGRARRPLWRTEWAWTMSPDCPSFSHRLLDGYGKTIYRLSSFDSEYNNYGIVYLNGTENDFVFDLSDPKPEIWSLRAYQELFSSEG